MLRSSNAKGRDNRIDLTSYGTTIYGAPAHTIATIIENGEHRVALVPG